MGTSKVRYFSRCTTTVLAILTSAVPGESPAEWLIIVVSTGNLDYSQSQVLLMALLHVAYVSVVRYILGRYLTLLYKCTIPQYSYLKGA